MTDAQVFYTGTYTGSNGYESDPSFNYFMGDLVLTEFGYRVGGSGDVFQVGGSFLNASTNVAQWETNLASLIFSGAGDHRFGVVAGVGALAFGWGGVRTDPWVRLSFCRRAVANNSMALYVGILELADGLKAILLSDLPGWRQWAVAAGTIDERSMSTGALIEGRVQQTSL